MKKIFRILIASIVMTSWSAINADICTLLDEEMVRLLDDLQKIGQSEEFSDATMAQLAKSLKTSKENLTKIVKSKSSDKVEKQLAQKSLKAIDKTLKSVKTESIDDLTENFNEIMRIMDEAYKDAGCHSYDVDQEIIEDFNENDIEDQENPDMPSEPDRPEVE